MNKAAARNSTSFQALWFLAVGASAALVHFLVLISIVNFTTVTPAWANVGAFLIAFMVSFFGHFYLTFKQSNRSNENNRHNNNIKSNRSKHLSTLVKWFGSSVIGFIANQSLFVLGLNWFGERYYVLIWLIVTGVITVMTFALGKFWAFK